MRALLSLLPVKLNSKIRTTGFLEEVNRGTQAASIQLYHTLERFIDLLDSRL